MMLYRVVSIVQNNKYLILNLRYGNAGQNAENN